MWKTVGLFLLAGTFYLTVTESTLVTHGGEPQTNVSASGDNVSDHLSQESGSQHSGMHVAKIQWDYVQEPMIITVFVIVAAITKIGEFLAS